MRRFPVLLFVAALAGGAWFFFQNYEIEATRRDELRKYLSDRGIGTIIQWGGTPVHRFKKLGFDVSLPATERFFERCMMLPLNMMVTDDEVTSIASAIREFYGASA